MTITYVLVGLVVLLLGGGIGLAMWIGRLKDQVQRWSVLHAQAVKRFGLEKQRAEQSLAQKRRLEEQLRVLRQDHERVLQTMESGAAGDAGAIAAELRRVHPDHP